MMLYISIEVCSIPALDISRFLFSANSQVTSVEHEGHLSRPQALVNLDRCLAHLAAHGVDVIGIQASGMYRQRSLVAVNNKQTA